jgi:putative spermidine/putrescine transport system ATP-binding protein
MSPDDRQRAGNQNVSPDLKLASKASARPKADDRAGADRDPRLGRPISLRGVSKHYGGVAAVDALDLEIRTGELVTLLGPSGSGKTTTLMMIAGFTDPTSGAILIDDREVTNVPAHKRGIGVVFQQYALFPHMTVTENVAFPLKMRGMGRSTIEDKVRSALELVEMSHLTLRYPGELSGGQQQRVAFARAIVFDPPVLLLDEPLGALDKKLREALQLEIKALHTRLGLTMVYVTHDQTEALAISDRVAVMNDGRLEQIGTPEELYDAPATRFTADFIGEANFLRGTVGQVRGNQSTVTMAGGKRLKAALKEGATSGEVEIVIRPERVVVGSDAGIAENQLEGILQDKSYVGDSTKYQIVLPSGETMTARVQNRRGHRIDADLGTKLKFGWDPEDALVFSWSDDRSGKGAK